MDKHNSASADQSASQANDEIFQNLRTVDPDAPQEPVLPYVTPMTPADDPFFRKAEMPAEELQEKARKFGVAPLVLAVVGWVIIAGVAAFHDRTGNVVATQAGVLVMLAVRVGVAAGVCFLGLLLTGNGIGRPQTYLFRVAGAVILPLSTSVLIPYLGEFALEPILFWCLLAWLFELDPMDAFVVSTVIWAGNFAIGLFLGVAAMASVFG